MAASMASMSGCRVSFFDGVMAFHDLGLARLVDFGKCRNVARKVMVLCSAPFVHGKSDKPVENARLRSAPMSRSAMPMADGVDAVKARRSQTQE